MSFIVFAVGLVVLVALGVYSAQLFYTRKRAQQIAERDAYRDSLPPDVPTYEANTRIGRSHISEPLAPIFPWAPGFTTSDKEYVPPVLVDPFGYYTDVLDETQRTTTVRQTRTRKPTVKKTVAKKTTKKPATKKTSTTTKTKKTPTRTK